MALAYLLSPTFEIVNSAGKPATGGYIETYVAGSRTKYFCASDFDGTRHPFRIPLDSLGSNVVLADDSGSYDVYVYNRYGTLLMSRYNVHPGEGGGLGGGTITSSDGSIIVTPTADGNDLRVNVGEPSVLRAGADTIYSSGPFVFSELVREGDRIWVDGLGKIRCRVGWYHYDITVRITWAPESPRNETIPVQLYTTLASNLTDFDASYTHDNTIRLSGETKIVENGAELAFGVLGLRNGLGAELIDMGVHAICIGTAGQSDLSAGTGIVIDQGEISVDPMYMSGYVTQPELTYGLAGKQDVISDLSTIRSGAAAGASAVQPAGMASALALKEDAANKSQTLDPTSATEFPSSAATANYVNSSVSTATANFLGNLTLTDLGLTYPATNVQIASALNSHTWPAGVTVTNNDYVYVEIQNPQTTSVDDRVERYKYSDGLASWGYEYTLNNSSFTAAEIAAIDSGITAADKTAYDTHVADGTIHVTAADKTAWDGKQDTLTAGSNITISSGTISATDTTYSAGTGLDLVGTVFSVDTTTIATKSDLEDYTPTASLAAVAISNDYDDLDNKPEIPTIGTVDV